MTARIKTGIPGFDEIIGGGLILNSVNLLSGGAGTGKTIFCMNFLFNGAKQYQDRGLYISFEESEEDLRADVAELGLNFDELSERIKFVCLPPYDIGNFPALLKEKLTSFSPSRVVVDSVSAIAMTMEDDFERRKQIYQLIQVLKKSGCTTILTSERPGEGTSESASFSRYGVEEFLADSLTILSIESMGGQFPRSLSVRKMRKTKHDQEIHPVEISDKGMIIHNLG